MNYFISEHVQVNEEELTMFLGNERSCSFKTEEVIKKAIKEFHECCHKTSATYDGLDSWAIEEASFPANPENRYSDD